MSTKAVRREGGWCGRWVLHGSKVVLFLLWSRESFSRAVCARAPGPRGSSGCELLFRQEGCRCRWFATRDDGWAERKSHKVDVISPGCPASRGHGNVIRQWCLVLRCGDVDRSCFPKLQNVRASELVAPRKRMLSKVFTRASGCDLAAYVDLSDKNRTTPAALRSTGGHQMGSTPKTRATSARFQRAWPC